MGHKRSAGEANDAALTRLLDEADAAFEKGDHARALTLAEKALALAPKAIEPLHYHAAALAGLGRYEDAARAYRKAMQQAPEDIEVIHGAAEMLVLDACDDERAALDDALQLLERGLKLARKKGDQEHRVEFLLLSGMALNKLGEAHRALGALDEAFRLAPSDVEVALERGIALFELCRFPEARRQLEKALALDRNDAWAHHYMGLIDEREGDQLSARRHFAEARKRAPEDFPAPIEFSPESFDKAVSDALGRLPPKVRSYLTNISIAVQDLPSDDDLKASEPPLSPAIVGLFHGTPITEKSVSDPWSHFPSAIVLYQRNLERFAKTRDELIEQIGITLIHEVGHFLGLSEEDLYERGLD